MRRHPTSSCILISLLLCLLPVYTAPAADFWPELRRIGLCDTYRPMTDTQLQRAETLFEQMLAPQRFGTQALADGWAQLGYALVDAPRVGDGWLLLHETQTPCTGGGFYLINRGNPKPLMVQAPHAYQDLRSGRIIAGLPRDDIAVLAWNSAKRRIRNGDKTLEADLAKRTDSLLLALSRAFARARRHGRLVQIHGFDNKRRTTQAGAAAAVIVSSGSRWSSPAAVAVARCLQRVVDGQVLIYPQQVSELGATKNIHGRTLRRYGHEGFVHVELNRQTRERLVSEPSLRSAFSRCLTAGMTE